MCTVCCWTALLWTLSVMVWCCVYLPCLNVISRHSVWMIVHSVECHATNSLWYSEIYHRIVNNLTSTAGGLLAKNVHFIKVHTHLLHSTLSVWMHCVTWFNSSQYWLCVCLMWNCFVYCMPVAGRHLASENSFLRRSSFNDFIFANCFVANVINLIQNFAICKQQMSNSATKLWLKGYPSSKFNNDKINDEIEMLWLGFAEASWVVMWACVKVFVSASACYLLIMCCVCVCITVIVCSKFLRA